MIVITLTGSNKQITNKKQTTLLRHWFFKKFWFIANFAITNILYLFLELLILQLIVITMIDSYLQIKLIITKTKSSLKSFGLKQIMFTS
jgi:hypothetical protein